MLVILEGTDLIGKSTAAERLRAALSISGDVEVLHKGPMTADAITEYELPLEDYLPGGGRHVICDRWHVGEDVYGPHLRGESRVSEAERLHIDKFLAARGAVLVHVTAAENLVRRRLAERGDDLITADDIPALTDAYYRVLNGLPSAVHTVRAVLTGEEEHDREQLQALLHHGAWAELQARHLPRHATYVGPPDPDILLLGERRNPTPHGTVDPHRGAFTPHPSTSGRFLLDALPPYLANHCGLANALEEDPVALYEDLHQPLVVALGREADRALDRAEVPHGAVPHPQGVRRFNFSRQVEYGRVIREAAYHQRDLIDVFRASPS